MLTIEPIEYSEQYLNRGLHRRLREFTLPGEHIDIVPDAIVTASSSNTDVSGLGAVYDSAGNILPASYHVRREMSFNGGAATQIATSTVPTTTATLHGTSIYLGWIFSHYGHFLIESLARCWILDQLNDLQDSHFVFHSTLQRDQVPDKYIELLGLAGIPVERIVIAQHNYRAEQLVIPNQQSILDRGISRTTLALYRTIGDAVRNDASAETSARIYISRSGLPFGKRKISNELLLEREYSARGFAVVHPQHMPLKQQILLFAQASEISGLDGSALHNVVFSRRCTLMHIYSTPDRVRPAIFQAYINEALGCRTEVRILQLQEVKLHTALPSLKLIKEDECPHVAAGDKLSHESNSEVAQALRATSENHPAYPCVSDQMLASLNADIRLALMAVVAKEDGRFEDGLSLIGQALAICPKSFPYLMIRARLLASLRRYSEAASTLLALRDVSPESKGFYPELTWRLVQAQRYAECRDVALAFLAQHPRHPQVSFHLAQANLALDDIDGANDAATCAREEAPDNVQYLMFCATLHRQAGNLALAEQLALHVIELDGENSAARKLLATIRR